MGDLADKLMEELECRTSFTIPVLGGIPVPESCVMTWIIMGVLVIASISGSEKIKRNLFLRPTNVDLSILDVVPADKVKEMSTNELADYSRGLIERSLPKAVKEAV